jgi:nicotinamide-nucleotide amidase
MPGGVDAAVVTVGDELLLGRTVDGNAAWLGRRLAELGAPVAFGIRAPDDDRAIAEAVDEALARAPLVVVTGGLGPTDDDRTRSAVAGLLGAPLELDGDLLRGLEARFRALDMTTLPDANRRQAMVPRGAHVLENPAGTAPGLAMDARSGRLVLLLPGPPRELAAVFPAAEKVIRARFGPRLRPVHVRTLHTTGIAESVLAPRVEEALGDDREVEAAFLPDLTGVDVRLTVRGEPSAAVAQARLDRAEDVLSPVLGRHRFRASETGDLVEAVATALLERGWTVGVAESCTGGLVGQRLTALPGASRYFVGGVVAYDDSVKSGILGVPEASLHEHGAVSGPVAIALAEGAARTLGTDCGVGVTGIAGPTGGSETKPVGTVWFGIVAPGVTRAVERRFVGDRSAVRIRAAQAALALLLDGVEGRSA